MGQKTVITNFGIGNKLEQVVEFNISLPTPARTDVAPVVTLTPTIRYSRPFLLGILPYYLTKVDLALQVNYTDVANVGRTFIVHSGDAVAITSTTPLTAASIITNKIIGLIIPPCVCKVTEAVINSTPTSDLKASNKGYFVFAIRATGTV